MIGHTYTLGKSAPWNISVKSAEYSVETIRNGDGVIYPNKEQKLLLIHLRVHNPQKRQALMRFDTIRFTAVDAHDKNWQGVGNINSEETKERIDQQFKPAQKMDIYTSILVPAAGEIPKLILTGGDRLVIRYDLRGKVKPLPEPFADPNDKTGATALAVIPAKLGVSYPAASFNMSVDAICFTDGPIDNQVAKSGERFLVANMSAKYVNTCGNVIRFDSFQFKGVDTDGMDINWGRNLLGISSDRHLDMHVEPGYEGKFRVFFKIEKGVVPQSIVITARDYGRSYKYSVE